MLNPKIKWVAIQPLVGGMAFAAEKVFKCHPSCVIDYQGVGNSDLYVDYMIKKGSLSHYKFDNTLYSKSITIAEDSKDADFESNTTDVDVAIGVPICAGLSSANHASAKDSSMGLGSDATQNNNMLSMLQYATTALKPKVYIFENAYKLATNLGDGIRAKLVKLANDAGYGVTLIKVNTENYGSPQCRTRTFFIASKDGYAYKLAKPNIARPSIEEVLKGLTNQKGFYIPDLAENPWYKYIYAKAGDNWRQYMLDNHVYAIDLLLRKDKDFDFAKQFFDEKGQASIERFKAKFADGKGWISDAPLYKGPYKISSIYSHGMVRNLHPTEMRGYSLREFMRIMGLPDDMPEPKAPYMIGQNVPVCTASYYMNQILNILNGKTEKIDKKFILLDDVPSSNLIKTPMSMMKHN